MAEAVRGCQAGGDADRGRADLRTLWLIGVSFPLLAVIVAVCEIIPRVGTWLARVPLFILAATDRWIALALTVASSVLIQDLKELVISPFIEWGRSSISTRY